MISRYERIKTLDPKTFRGLIAVGIISVDVLTWVTVYEFYTLELKDGVKKMQAYENTAEHFKVSTSTIRRVVSFMNKKA